MNKIKKNNGKPQTLPHVIEMRLSFLIRRYLQTQTKNLANAIVQQLELLLKHPDCIGFPNDRCAYKKMLMQWRLLAD